MAAARPAPRTESFLDELRARHGARLPREADYEAMMYAARNPPSSKSLAPLLHYLQAARSDARLDADALTVDTMRRLGELLARMVWPDPEPLVLAARILPSWNTVALTTLLHTQIPDYPIFGPAEAAGLERLGTDVRYDDDPQRATAAYGAAIQAVKALRENARYDQVPESHHFLTRIVQTALQETGTEAS